MTWPRALPWIAVLLLAGLVLGDVPLPGGGAELEPGGSAGAAVERVIDGDTIVVRLGDREERVRYIGIDTPETVKPQAPVECFGVAAHDLNARLLEQGDGRVTLRFDRELRDRYGRLLAYVYRTHDGAFVNARLIRAGVARTLPIDPNTAHAPELARLQSAARAGARGLWGACESP
jgi:micrococcal nuclease